MTARRPDPEIALRVAADEVFLAGLRGEHIHEVDSHRSNERGVWTDSGELWKVHVATDSGHDHGITVLAWRDDAP